jgi:hypothetical protein
MLRNLLMSPSAGFSRITAIGTGGLVRYKALPVTSGSWTNPQTLSPYSGGSLAFGGGLYVTGSYESVWTSPDGAAWTSRPVTPLAGADVQNVAYGAGVFVVIAGLSDVLASSPDGITWTARTSTLGTENTGTLIFGGNCFLATARYGRVMRSTDGITWTSVTTGLPTGAGSLPYCAVWTGSEFVIATTNSLEAVRSTDGVTWSALTIGTRGTGAYYGGAAFGPGKGLILMEAGGYYRKSDASLSSWTQYQISGMPSGVAVITYDGTNFVVGSTGTSVCKYSSDGITWTDISANLSLGGNYIYGLLATP